MKNLIQILALVLVSFSFSTEGLCQESDHNDLINSLFYNLYSFHFQNAEKDLNKIEKKISNEDLKDICIANFHWWNIATREEYQENTENMLHALDRIIARYTNIPIDQLGPEAIFAISHAYAYKTRLEMHEDNYIKGASNLKQAVKYLEIILPRAEENIQFKLLAGLYHYVLGSVLKEYPIIRPLFLLSPKTDLTKGLQLLEECASNEHPLIRTEARYFLTRVQHAVNLEYHRADKNILILLKEFPENIYFRSYRINILADAGRVKEVQEELTYLSDQNNANQVDMEQLEFILKETYTHIRKKRIKI